MAAGDSNPQFFGNSLAEMFRQAVMKIARSGKCCVFHHERRRSSDGNTQPYKGGDGKAAKRAKLKPQGVWRAKVMHYRESKNKGDGGNGGQRDQSNVNGAMKLLSRPAVDAFGEMRLVVATHLRRESGDVIAPSSKDMADEWIDAFTHKQITA